jgi:hypothetical protein
LCPELTSVAATIAPIAIGGDMKNTDHALTTLKRELEFLDHGGYRTSVGSRQPLFCMETEAGWHKPLFFEDSPSCPKKKYCPCDPEGDCVLMSLVPNEHRHDPVPCRQIPLNEKGDTIEALSKAGRREEIESTLRTWLVRAIGELEKAH